MPKVATYDDTYADKDLADSGIYTAKLYKQRHDCKIDHKIGRVK